MRHYVDMVHEYDLLTDEVADEAPEVVASLADAPPAKVSAVKVNSGQNGLALLVGSVVLGVGGAVMWWLRNPPKPPRLPNLRN